MEADTYDVVPLSNAQSDEVWNSDEAQTYLSLKDQFVTLIGDALQRGVTEAELRRAAKRSVDLGDDSALAALLFEDPEDATAYVDQLQAAYVHLEEAYPVVQEAQVEPQACAIGGSTVDAFFDNYDTIRTVKLAQTTASRVPPVCGSGWNQVKFLACAGLCGATTGGLGAGLCGWGCLCTFCSDSVTGGVMC